MAFRWQIPYQPPDAAALERMRQHFLTPTELMPEAWFMSGTTYIAGYDDVPPETIDADGIGYLFREIWTGIAFFPGVSADRWKAWFRYLLPYALVLVNTRQDDSRLDRLQEGIFRAFCHIYPQQIIEEYPGFRDDVVYTLGSHIIPDLLSRDDSAPMSASLQNPVFNDIWDFTNSPGKETPGLYEEFDLPMQFCLHYLNEAEIETWVDSLLSIDSPQWRLAIITWWLGRYAAPVTDTFIVSAANLGAFAAAMRRGLTADRFRQWAADIKSHQTFRTNDDYVFPIGADLVTAVDQALANFEQVFFHV